MKKVLLISSILFSSLAFGTDNAHYNAENQSSISFIPKLDSCRVSSIQKQNQLIVDPLEGINFIHPYCDSKIHKQEVKDQYTKTLLVTSSDNEGYDLNHNVSNRNTNKIEILSNIYDTNPNSNRQLYIKTNNNTIESLNRIHNNNAVSTYTSDNYIVKMCNDNSFRGNLLIDRELSVSKNISSFVQSKSKQRDFYQDIYGASNVVLFKEIAGNCIYHKKIPGLDGFNTIFSRQYNNSMLQDEFKCQSLTDKIFATLSLTSALMAIHAAGYVHGDLKLENIIISNNKTIEQKDHGFCISIIDLGGTVKNNSQSNKIKGTRGYIDPWLILQYNLNKKITYTYKNDIYAMGILLTYLLFDYNNLGESLVYNYELTKTYFNIYKYIEKPHEELRAIVHQMLPKMEKFNNSEDQIKARKLYDLIADCLMVNITNDNAPHFRDAKGKALRRPNIEELQLELKKIAFPNVNFLQLSAFKPVPADQYEVITGHLNNKQ